MDTGMNRAEQMNVEMDRAERRRIDRGHKPSPKPKGIEMGSSHHMRIKKYELRNRKKVMAADLKGRSRVEQMKEQKRKSGWAKIMGFHTEYFRKNPTQTQAAAVYG